MGDRPGAMEGAGRNGQGLAVRICTRFGDCLGREVAISLNYSPSVVPLVFFSAESRACNFKQEKISEF